MTFAEIEERIPETQRYTVLAHLMDDIEEETGKFPDWSDEAPQWVLEFMGIKEV